MEYFRNTIKNTERKVREVDIYLSDLTLEAERLMIETFLVGLPEVDPTQTVYKTKADALQEFKKHYPDNPELWQYLAENPLPASFELITRIPRT